MLQVQLLGERIGAGWGVVDGEPFVTGFLVVLLLGVVPSLLPVAFAAALLLYQCGARVCPLLFEDELFLGA